MRLNQTLCIAGIWIINLNTLWFVKPLSQNLSHLGNALHMRWYLMLWAASAALYFYVYTRKWMASLNTATGLVGLYFHSAVSVWYFPYCFPMPPMYMQHCQNGILALRWDPPSCMCF